jgi:hypothetical protein
VGLLGWLPGVAAAAQPDPGLSSFALSGLGLETGSFLREQLQIGGNYGAFFRRLIIFSLTFDRNQ